MKLRITFALTLLALTGAAMASAEGNYYGIQLGMADTDDTEFETALGTIGTTFDSGLAYGVTFGRSMDNFRLEGELSRRDSDVDKHSLGGASLDGATGEASVTSLMANVYYDFATSGRVKPYVGAGLGLASVDLSNFGVAVVPDVLDADDDVFAYQAILGLGVDLSDKVMLTFDARLFETEDAAVTTSAVSGGVDTEVGYTAIDARVGLRISF